MPSDRDLAKQRETEEQRVRRNLRTTITPAVLGALVLALVIAGLLIGSRRLSSTDQNTQKTNVVQASKPAMQTENAQTAASTENKFKQEAVQDTPDGYLALMGLDPATIPPEKKSVAQILNNAGSEAAHGGEAQFAFLQSLDANLFRPMQAAKDKESSFTKSDLAVRIPDCPLRT
jgi:hypothetical protein